MDVAVNPGALGHALALAAAAIDKIAPEVIAVLLLAIDVEIRTVAPIFGIATELGVNDGIAKEIEQTAQNQPNTNRIACSPLQREPQISVDRSARSRRRSDWKRWRIVSW